MGHAVSADITRTLATNLENLTLTGSSAINGAGNTRANVLTGNGNANTLAGGEGNDTYVGAVGSDELNDTSTSSADLYRWDVGQGNDSITDAAGADRIETGAGVTAGVAGAQRQQPAGHNWWSVRCADRRQLVHGHGQPHRGIRLADGTIINAEATAPLSVVSPLAREVPLGPVNTNAAHRRSARS